MKLPVLIIAPGNDSHARAVVDALAKHHIAVEWVDFAALNQDVRLSLVLGSSTDAHLIIAARQTINLSEVNTIWWRRPLRPPDCAERDAETKTFARGEWDHFIDGLEAFVPSRWVNKPSASHLAGRKGFQLVAARAEGLRVPRTVMTNDAEAVRALAGENIPLIYKRIGAASTPLTATKPLEVADLDRLDSLCNCPAIFQERINARFDIRVTAIGADLHAVEIDSQIGKSPLDWRFDLTVPFRSHVLDGETARRLRALMKRLDLVYGAIDLRLTPEGEYVFLEINPSGQYLFVELLAQIPLSDRMAEFLGS